LAFTDNILSIKGKLPVSSLVLKRHLLILAQINTDFSPLKRSLENISDPHPPAAQTSKMLCIFSCLLNGFPEVH
jgi:hypothetical protein